MLTKITKHAEIVGFCQLFGFKTASIYFKETKVFFVFPLVIVLLQLSLQSCADVQIETKYKYVEWTSSTKGIKKARKLYKRWNNYTY